MPTGTTVTAGRFDSGVEYPRDATRLARPVHATVVASIVSNSSASNTVLDIGYFGSKGTHLIGAFELNELAARVCDLARCDRLCGGHFNHARLRLARWRARLSLFRGDEHSRSDPALPWLSFDHDDHAAVQFELPQFADFGAAPVHRRLAVQRGLHLVEET